MTNTYPEDEEPFVKIAEELRLIRCILERRLSDDKPKMFLDYQMEKFGTGFKLDRLDRKEEDTND